MVYTLCDIYNDLDNLGVNTFNCSMKSNWSICSPDGYVGIDETKVETDAHLRTILMHEAGHFYSGAFYMPYSPFVLRGQAEYRANKAAILKYIPKSEIDFCVSKGMTELWELADYFNVTEDFMLKALLFYQERQYAR